MIYACHLNCCLYAEREDPEKHCFLVLNKDKSNELVYFESILEQIYFIKNRVNLHI